MGRLFESLLPARAPQERAVVHGLQGVQETIRERARRRALLLKRLPTMGLQAAQASSLAFEALSPAKHSVPQQSRA